MKFTHICILWLLGSVDLKCHNPTKLVFAWYLNKIFRWLHFSSTQMKPCILIVFRRGQNFPQKWSKLLGDLDLCSWVTIQLIWIFKKNPKKECRNGQICLSKLTKYVNKLPRYRFLNFYSHFWWKSWSVTIQLKFGR